MFGWFSPKYKPCRAANYYYSYKQPVQIIRRSQYNDHNSVFDRLDHIFQLWIALRFWPIARFLQKTNRLAPCQQSSGLYYLSIYTRFFYFFIFLVLHNFVFLGLCADLLRAWGFLYTEVVSTYPGTTLFCPWTLLERLIMWTILGKAKYANQYEKVALC